MASVNAAAPDQVLAMLVGVVNRLEAVEGIGVSLTVNGLVIAGKLIPNYLWLREVEGQIDSAVRDTLGREPDEDERGFASLFAGVAEGFEKRRDAIRAARDAAPELANEADDIDRENTGFIHLREAQVFTPGSLPIPQEGMHWRGRLSEVDGWTFGRLGPGRAT